MTHRPPLDTKGATMDTIDLHEHLSSLISELDKREFEPERPFWFINNGENNIDESETYCWDCVMAEKPDAELGDDFIGGGYSEHDSPEICSQCGKLLQYTLTDYGVAEELRHFLDAGFDYNSPQECFELARVAHGIYKNEQQSRQLYEVLATGMNFPPGLLATEKGAPQ